MHALKTEHHRNDADAETVIITSDRELPGARSMFRGGYAELQS